MIIIYIFISYSRYIGNKQIKYTNNPQFRIAMELAEVKQHTFIYILVILHVDILIHINIS